MSIEQYSHWKQFILVERVMRPQQQQQQQLQLPRYLQIHRAWTWIYQLILMSPLIVSVIKWATERWLHVIIPMWVFPVLIMVSSCCISHHVLNLIEAILLHFQCRIEWFHFGCVGLKEKPKGKWYCTDCAGTQKRRKGKWSQNWDVDIIFEGKNTCLCIRSFTVLLADYFLSL